MQRLAGIGFCAVVCVPYEHIVWCAVEDGAKTLEVFECDAFGVFAEHAAGGVPGEAVLVEVGCVVFYFPFVENCGDVDGYHSI